MSRCPSIGPSHSGIQAPRRHPPMLRMVLEALQAGEQRRGTSVVAIKVYILRKYPTVDAIRLKYLLKRALDTGMQRGLFVRPTNSKARGATGSFKVSLLVGGAGVGERKQKDERDSALFLASVCYSPARGLFPHCLLVLPVSTQRYSPLREC